MFVKVNTGMNRLGVAPADGRARWSSACRHCESVAALRLMTHFARADEDDGVAEPLARVRGGVHAGCRTRARSPTRRASIRYAEVGGDIVRPGIMLYGATPFAVRHRRDARPAAGDDAALASSSPCRSSRPNDSRRLRRRATSRRGRTRIGVVACGYADGYPRHAPNGTPVLVCGRKVRIAGRVSMDMITVDLTEVPEARVGSPVVLWGEGLPVDDVAGAASTVGYELLCAVAPRVPFVVTEVGRIDLEL